MCLVFPTFYIYLQLGEGDCDSDTSCAGKLKCGTDNCVGEFFDATDDCCYSASETTEKPKSSIDIIGSVVDCTAIGDAQLIIRNTRIAYGCDIGNPTITLNTCSQISCLQDIVEKSVSCARETEKMDCPSLQKVSAALLTVSKQYCDGEFNFIFSRSQTLRVQLYIDFNDGTKDGTVCKVSL